MRKSVQLFNFLVAFTQPPAVLLSTIRVTLWVCGRPCPLGLSRQPQSSRIFLLASRRLAIATIQIDKMVISMIDITIISIDSSSPGQCHEHSWVLFWPSLFPAMSGFTLSDGKAKWLEKEISQRIATHLYERRPVTRGFFLVVFCIYISSGSAKEASQ